MVGLGSSSAYIVMRDPGLLGVRYRNSTRNMQILSEWFSYRGEGQEGEFQGEPSLQQ